MITADMVQLYRVDTPSCCYSPMSRHAGERWIKRGGYSPADQAADWALRDHASCICCGEYWRLETVADGTARCHRHRHRNPCAIEGCARTTKAPDGRPSNDDWLCSTHWRMFVPPRSPQRRAYHRFFRIAKKRGWDATLRTRFWRYWRGLIARARRGTGGDIDEREINKLFGWE